MQREITIDINGKSYSGRYEVKRKVLTLSSSYGTKSTQLGSLPAETLAKMLLGELVRENP